MMNAVTNTVKIQGAPTRHHGARSGGLLQPLLTHNAATRGVLGQPVRFIPATMGDGDDEPPQSAGVSTPDAEVTNSENLVPPSPSTPTSPPPEAPADPYSPSEDDPLNFGPASV